ncbi:hypothetical protein HPP92_023803 [Vanilla planifolia]|uniref:CRM domain-containing protein n=1 Tax=Vanilla planifolia TaxID=51239 RepID=A0A835PP48_VANPL|nr:hypothetical protein HPP92_023803 [Vanilla planifolia]
MLWKPITPVYPRLVQRAPEGLTLEEAMEMRKKGRLLPPICKLGKNGLYANLVKNVQEAFEECELVRINCKGLNKSDCRKIGAKLRDLVPCVLVSFEHEHILMWRGKDWKSSLASSQDACREATEQVAVVSSDTSACDQSVEENMNPTEDIGTKDSSGLQKMDPLEVEPTALSIIAVVTENFESSATINQELPSSSSSDGTVHSIVESGSASLLGKDMVDTNLPWMEEVMLLVKQAVEKGSAEVLEDEYLDADAVLERSMALAKRAPVCPTFQHQSKKATTQKAKKEKNESIEEKIEENDDVVDALVVSQEEGDGRRKSRSRKTERTFLDVVPHGSLRVDELAKLLA